LKLQKIATRPRVKAKSATRFTMRALMAALFACIRVYQKLIKRYEQSPTPSQPRNKITKLSPVTNINIKKVNKDK
jgi:molybdenum cofactor biosynthesis enzyme